MKRLLLALLLLIPQCHPIPMGAADVRVYFSPNGQCTEAAVAEINKAKTSVAFEAYNFTSPEILKALLAAKKRGVGIAAVYDRSQKNNLKTLADELGVQRLYGTQKIMHNKVLVIDEKVVVTGSFNWTTNAQKFNAENMVVIEDKGIAKQYLLEFKHLADAATR